MTKFNAAELEKIFSEIEKKLLKSNIEEIKYEKKDTEIHFRANNKDFLDDIKGESVVYCIWRKEKSQKKDFVPVYIGQAKKSVVVERMRNHLSKKNAQTGACLKEVKQAVNNDETIGVTFVRINPSYMRLAVEEWLIGKLTSKNSEALPWNKKGRKTKPD